MARFLIRVAVEPVYAVPVGRASGAEIPNAPFAENRRGVICLFHGFRQGIGFCSDGPVPFEVAPVFACVHALQVPHVAIARMPARHQYIAEGGANRGPGIEVNPPLLFGGQPVNVRFFNFFCP